MTQRTMALQGTLVLGLIVGIVGGNFVLHRWILGDAASREADAGTTPASSAPDDLDEYARFIRSAATPVDPAAHRERLRKLIAEKLPNISAEEQDSWVEELSDVSLSMADGILDLRGQVGALPAIEDTPDRNPVSADPIHHDFGLGITR
ncbi:MAG: hypothetical protein IAG10_17850 [Planctomycetaceae bacterium]|nr:hypothetical protein [Planctomycetaceae bacterium]